MIVIGLTWSEYAISSAVIGAVAILYLLAAIWLGWSWVLVPALVSVNLTALTLNLLAFDGFSAVEQGLLIPHLGVGKLGDLERLYVQRALVHRQHAHVFIG